MEWKEGGRGALYRRKCCGQAQDKSEKYISEG